MAKTIFYSLAALVRKILFCHSKIKFISSHHRVISLPGDTPLYKPYRCVHFKARYLSQWKAVFHWWLNCISSQFLETDLAMIWVKRVKREFFGGPISSKITVTKEKNRWKKEKAMVALLVFITATFMKNCIAWLAWLSRRSREFIVCLF